MEDMRTHIGVHADIAAKKALTPVKYIFAPNSTLIHELPF